MLDDMKILTARDSESTLASTATQHEQTTLHVEVKEPDYDGRNLTNIVVAGMGGSGLAAQLAKTWLDSELAIPLEVIHGYTLPNYVGDSTLVIASSCSGNTEETLACLEEAQARSAQVAVISGGGKLAEVAKDSHITRVDLPTELKIQPRMLTIAQLRALTALLAHFQIINFDRFGEIADAHDWLASETANWTAGVSVDKNYAKQLALLAVGKTPIFYGGEITSSAAYKWKISWNENAKNVAFWNQYPEFNHNEFIGWTSHPVEKPFAIFDLVSQKESPRILKRFEVSDRLLSGKRPKATTIEVKGDTVLKQLLWANILADFTSIYVAILNNVDPGPVTLITKLKEELASNDIDEVTR